MHGIEGDFFGIQIWCEYDDQGTYTIDQSQLIVELIHKWIFVRSSS